VFIKPLHRQSMKRVNTLLRLYTVKDNIISALETSFSAA